MLKWIKRVFIIAVILFLGWLANTIWFKPFTLTIFFEKWFIEHLEENHNLLITTGWLDDLHVHVDLDIEQHYQSKKNSVSQFEKANQQYKTLTSYPLKSANFEKQLSFKTLQYFLEDKVYESQIKEFEYPLNPIDGVHISLPLFFENALGIKNIKDAYRYVHQLNHFSFLIEKAIAEIDSSTSHGIIMPVEALQMMQKEIEFFTSVEPKQNFIYKDFIQKLGRLDEISNEVFSELKYLSDLIISEKLYPNYITLDKKLKFLIPQATKEGGLWKKCNEQRLFLYLLKKELGIEYAEIVTETNPDGLFEKAMKEIDFHKKQLRDSPNQLESNANFDSVKIEESFLAFKKLMTDKFLRFSIGLPSYSLSNIQIKPFPIQETVSAFYYFPLNINRTRKAVLYYNRAYFEAFPPEYWKIWWLINVSPGKHLQKTYQLNNHKVPSFRRFIDFSELNQGWAFYALEVIEEKGALVKKEEVDALNHWKLIQLGKMIVDIGMNYKSWKYDRAMTFLQENVYLNQEIAGFFIQECLNYPGRAVAAIVIKDEILSLREKIQKEMGKDFRLHKFHKAILDQGAIPMQYLESSVKNYLTKDGN